MTLNSYYQNVKTDGWKHEAITELSKFCFPMMAVDMDNSKIWWGVDGSWMGTDTGDNDGNPATGANPAFDNLSGDLFPGGACQLDPQYWNFGQLGFAHTPPPGFRALSTANLDDPTIADPSAYFQPTIYTFPFIINIIFISLIRSK